MPRVVHLRLKNFLRPGEHYHFAETELTPDNTAPCHDHDFHEVFWVQRGRGEHRFNGRTSPLQEGGLYLVRPSDRHCVVGVRNGRLRIANVAFPSKRWAEIRRRYFPRHADIFEAPGAERVWTLTTQDRDRLATWVKRLDVPGRPALEIDAFLMELPRFGRQVASREEEAIPAWLLRAKTEIAHPQHFTGGTPAFARLAGRSPSHVARATVKWLGTTPTEIVNRARMDHLAAQLASTQKPILELALDCGLTNLSHVYALFRARFGLSPRKYRQRYRGIV